jgi:hypothetical protein
MTELEATAYHESGHVMAVRHVKRRALAVSVTSEKAGYTLPDKIPEDPCQVALVGLAGIQAESLAPYSLGDLDAAIRAYVAAASDRNQIAKAFDQVWLSRNALWHQAQYDKALKFVQEHQKEITTLATAVLKITGFPKTLNETEIEAALRT